MKRRDPVRVVRREERHDVARPDAALGEGGGDAVDVAGELTEGERRTRAAVDDGDVAVAVAEAVAEQEPVERDLGDADVGVRTWDRHRLLLVVDGADG